MSRATTAEQYKLVTSYETVRRKLRDDRYVEHLDKPLAYWALPNDRRLPLALLDRPLGDLIAQPFDVLSATPGIGQKKIGAMIKLLLRATRDDSPDMPLGMEKLIEGESIDTEQSEKQNGRKSPEQTFDASLVSESQWVRWKETIRRHEVENEKIGRLAPSLVNVPTVIWHTPLSYYLPYTVAEVRQLRTHGEKRVAVVLEVFYLVHRILSDSVATEYLTIRLMPKFAMEVEGWISSVLQQERAPDQDEIRKQLVLPLLRQARLDVNDSVVKLLEGRLGVRGKPQSVRAQSRRLGVTRARVYQLLDECGKAMAVRWPEGRGLLLQLEGAYDNAEVPAAQRKLFDATIQLFFPGKFAEEEQRDHDPVA